MTVVSDENLFSEDLVFASYHHSCGNNQIEIILYLKVKANFLPMRHTECYDHQMCTSSPGHEYCHDYYRLVRNLRMYVCIYAVIGS